MGQKSNILTLNKNKQSITLYNLGYNNFLYGINFLKNFKKSLEHKKIFLSKSSFNILGNQLVLNLDLFFRTVKINNFRRNILSLKKNQVFSKSIFSNIFSKIFPNLKVNLIILSVKTLNIDFDKNLFLKLFSKFKRFHNTLFPRRFNFFIDFLKISTLFFFSKVNLKFYIEIIGQIFKILPKRRHNFFLSFIEQFFRVLIYDFKMVENSNLRGVKFMISGRIQAKPRAKFKYFQLGQIPMQSVEKNIDFSKIHVYTFYGVFGLKIWTYRV
jgi:hypothetical protein